MQVSRRHGIATQAKEATTSYMEDHTIKPNQNGDDHAIEDRSSSQGNTGGEGGEVIVDRSRGVTPHMNETSVAMKLGGRNAPRRRERTQAQAQRQLKRQQKEDALSADANTNIHSFPHGSQLGGEKGDKSTLNSKAKNISSLDSRLEAALRRVDLWKQHARPNTVLHAHSDESLAPQNDGTASSPALRRRNQHEKLHDDATASKTKTMDLKQIMDRASQITDKWRKYDRGLSNADSRNPIDTSKEEDETETEKALVEICSDDFVDVSISHFIRGVVDLANSITNVSDSEVHLREDENETGNSSPTKGAVPTFTQETEDPIEKSAVAHPCHHDSNDNENEDFGIGSNVHVTTRASPGVSSSIFSSVSSNDFTVHHHRHHRQQQEQEPAGINGDSLEEGEDRAGHQGVLSVERPTVFEFLEKVATECIGEELKEDVMSCLEDSVAEDNIQVSMEDDGLDVYIYMCVYITNMFFFAVALARDVPVV
jgi:hypothetical protein